MKKKELYAAPAAEVLELSLGGVILAMSGDDDFTSSIPGLGEGGLGDLFWD